MRKVILNDKEGVLVTEHKTAVTGLNYPEFLVWNGRLFECQDFKEEEGYYEEVNHLVAFLPLEVDATTA